MATKPRPHIIGVYWNPEKTDISWHISGAISDYATICGIDGDDPNGGQCGTVSGTTYQKIDCRQCKDIWEMCMKYKASNFKPQF